MTAARREIAIEALKSLVSGAYPWKTGPARRLKLWSDVPATSRPACFMFEGGQETYSWNEGATPKRAIDLKLFVYLNAKDPAVIGATLINDVMDALDDAFALSGADLAMGRNTLGGAVHHCRIDGKTLKDPGDLDGDALLIVPVKLILP
ncbi:hypothetical protein [Methylocella tundrae]|jgi:hypothetical protein|uniref:Uncharacterized protein n=1 Tax=Methylocella tundrae TaxID=227605 RepID=A0A4V6IMW7_METTU|nr:hypothetical protein [Methylocella tundrae]WPP04024.1 hypothetical protein SIN04_16425 [Methylocella tundrae]VFU10252.1 conserved protein of unknown function [Methylocella tundrae]